MFKHISDSDLASFVLQSSGSAFKTSAVIPSGLSFHFAQHVVGTALLQRSQSSSFPEG